MNGKLLRGNQELGHGSGKTDLRGFFAEDRPGVIRHQLSRVITYVWWGALVKLT